MPRKCESATWFESAVLKAETVLRILLFTEDQELFLGLCTPF